MASHIGASLRSNGKTLIINFTGNIGVGVVGPSDETVFLLENKETVTVFPTSIQSYTSGKDEFYDQQYFISEEQLNTLLGSNIIAIRREFNSNYIDVDIIELKRSKQFIELVKLFLDEYKKSNSK